MPRVRYALIVAALLAAPAALGAEVVKQPVKPFKTLRVFTCADVTVKPGADTALVVEPATVPLEVRQDGDELVIKQTRPFSGFCSGNEVAKLTVTATFAADAEVVIELSGRGSVEAEVGTVKALTVLGHGALDGTLKGAASACAVTVSGKGEVDAEALKCDDARATVNGTGAVHFPEVKKVAAEINGKGKVTYHGKAEVGAVVVRGNGKLEGR